MLTIASHACIIYITPLPQALFLLRGEFYLDYRWGVNLVIAGHKKRALPFREGLSGYPG